MGWEPTTFYVYDEDGRLVSSQPEPEYDELEREWQRALAAYRAEHLCPLCGLPKVVCRDQANESRFKADSERCHMSSALARRKRIDQEAKLDLPESLAYSGQYVPPED